ncbi:MAG: V-type ATPase subunit [Spirochaetaceae bacterium]|jgi:vacuolar-type H+-ATPase subunit C/Vma6|nr:V-type ATPase subunit [Spirochaetaceae bacterium]
MTGSGERAYAFAKACGVIGKSFVGKGISRLSSVTRLTELDRLVFPHKTRDLPERELLVDLERRITGRAVKQITSLVRSFSNPPELLLRLVRSYEYGDIKSALSAITGAEAKKPEFTGLGDFGTVNFKAFPDLAAMVTDTEFAFLLKEDIHADKDGILLQTKLDRRYYTLLWNSLFSLPGKDRTAIEKILAEEISLRNASWALRLRTYYGMPPEEIKNILVPIKTGKKHAPQAPSHTPEAPGERTLADDALASLSMALDNPSDWEKWGRTEFLNPERPGEPWKADPRYFQNAAAQYLYHLARQFFRRSPFSIDTVSCFIKLKQFEEDLLTSVAEGLGLGLSAKDVFAMLEVEP